jgi:hypothetical protein
VQKLNLATRGYQQTSTANGTATVSQHLVSIAFPGTGLLGRTLHSINSVNLSGQQIQALIGRDLMSKWLIVYNGGFGTVSISD